MEYQELKEIIKDMENCKLDSVKIEFPDGTKISMKKNQSNYINMTNEIQPKQININNENTIVEKTEEDVNNLKVIKSPMVGTFYSSPSPKDAPFVKKGDKVRKGDVICVVEAMKLMNEIESEFDGEIVEICVNNEEMVDYGTPLFKIK